MKTTITLLFVFSTTFILAQSVPYAVNYQSIARDIDGIPIPEANINGRVNIIKGSPSGQVLFSEEHTTKTNTYGLYLFTIGEGNITSGELEKINWATDDYYIETIISIDGGSDLQSVAKLNSVPYAFLSYRSVIDEVDDADNDPTNELQDLILDGAELSITNGSTVDLLPLVGNGWAEDDQIILGFDLNGNTLRIEIEDGNSMSVDLSPLVGNGGGSNQELILNGTELSLSNGNTIDLADLIPPGGTDDQKLESFEINGTELILTLENGGTLSVDFADLDIEQTLTSLSLDLSINTLEYIDELGQSNTLDLCQVVDNCETVTVLSYNASTNNLEYLDENNAVNEIPLGTGGTNTDQTLTTLSYSQFTHQLIYVDENGETNIIDLSDILSAMTDLADGHVIATHTSGDGTVTDIEETITRIVDNGDGTFTYFDEVGDPTIINKNNFKDDDDDDEKSMNKMALTGSTPTSFIRGSNTLKDGECFIPFTDSFIKNVDVNTITILLTPHSADTYGLAALEKSSTGFRVKELMGGTSSYTFDWEVKATKK